MQHGGVKSQFRIKKIYLYPKNQKILKCQIVSQKKLFEHLDSLEGVLESTMQKHSKHLI